MRCEFLAKSLTLLWPLRFVLRPSIQSTNRFSMASSSSINSTSRRLFIGIELPTHIRSHCYQTIVNRLIPCDNSIGSDASGNERTVKWVLDESLFHCTLQFLGNVKEDDVAALVDMLTETCRHAPPIVASLGGLGCMPSTQNARVIKFGFTKEGSKQVAGLAENVVMEATSKLGFRRDRRPYNAHVTLGRVREQKIGNNEDFKAKNQRFNSMPLPMALKDVLEQQQLGCNAIEEEEYPIVLSPQLATFEVNHIALVHSTLSENGPAYETIHRFSLLG
mmetsp:Transcript_6900/g.10178  ORF Transcript_6900/g.10178 Transcript_6900/m.10178 type:complete len:277 (-) Transcript_6900:430-1260(-)